MTRTSKTAAPPKRGRRSWLRTSAMLATIALVAATAAVTSRLAAAEATTVAALAQQTHFHGIAVDPTESSRLYLATHHGLYAVAPDGSATRLSPVQDFMGFTPHPTDPSILYASGHPAGGGNLGFIVSEDGGGSWRQLAEGVDGPVDFHQMDVSPADPKTIYGAYAGNLQISRDGGRTWEVVGPAPDGLIDLAASSKESSTLYAATQNGLLTSADGGKTWDDAYWLRQPATMVHVTPDGAVYAFLVGTGLIETMEPKLSWQTVSKDGFGDDYALHFAVDPTSHGKRYAISVDPQSQEQAVLASDDAGRTWAPLAESTH
jgi:photosystem II stability/assembly factor-like uncharacterized protein